jgi:coproporphyrinogen III oxidase
MTDTPRGAGVTAGEDFKQRMAALVRKTQDDVCDALSALDGGVFREDAWTREGGGGGRSRVLQDGAVFEKAGVMVSVVHGTLDARAAQAMRANHALPPGELSFHAAGVSMVVHPHNPLCPTFHANFRYFEVDGGKAWWFGGGADLTPNYLFEDDARHFHAAWKSVCDRHDGGYYPRFKAWCDDYFHIVHRGERRGIGGIFFDDLEGDRDALFGFVSDACATIVPAYLPIAERRHAMPFTSDHKRWQQLRRGRYVEFNLVYDRGTTFGLRTNARIESVLVSLPLTARWEYDMHPEPGSEEERMLDVLRAPREWL